MKIKFEWFVRGKIVDFELKSVKRSSVSEIQNNFDRNNEKK